MTSQGQDWLIEQARDWTLAYLQTGARSFLEAMDMAGRTKRHPAEFEPPASGERRTSGNTNLAAIQLPEAATPV